MSTQVSSWDSSASSGVSIELPESMESGQERRVGIRASGLA